ncbi:MAG: hypothetical protein ACKV0T_18240 [Planctomycetales bacterium]
MLTTRTLRQKLLAGVACALLVEGCAAEPSASSVTSARRSANQVPDPYRIELEGNQGRWRAHYPATDEVAKTDSAALAVRRLHVPQGVAIELTLRSSDFVYTLALPAMGLKEIAVPSLTFRLEFGPLAAGRFALEGSQLCGDPHTDWHSELIVEPPETLQEWLQQQRDVSVLRVAP